jgi:hypothetical protein
MDATRIDRENATALGAPIPAGSGVDTDSLIEGWDTLHEAAAIVAVLAGVRAESWAGEMRTFGARLSQAPHWLHDTARQGIEDLAAIMEPGLAALLTVHSAGGDPAVPARALWREFIAARDALLAIALPRN